MQLFTLRRHGKPDLVFQGRLLAGIDERDLAVFASDVARLESWWTLSLFKTSVDKYLLCATFTRRAPDEQSMNTVIAFDKGACVREFFAGHEGPNSALARELLGKAAMRDPDLASSGDDAGLHAANAQRSDDDFEPPDYSDQAALEKAVHS